MQNLVQSSSQDITINQVKIFNSTTNQIQILIIITMLKIQILLALLFTATLAALPSSLNWANKQNHNYMGTIKNQNLPHRCESGWALSSINMLSSRVNIRMAQSNFSSPSVSLSAQVLLQCDSNNFGCLGGEPLGALRWIKRNNITDQSCNYYKAQGYTNGLTCKSTSKCQKCENKTCTGQPNSKIYALHDMGTLQGQQQMQQQINSYGPIVCSIVSNDNFKKYSGGVLNGNESLGNYNHYVTIYGWGLSSGVKFWNGMNSYGSTWGEEGFFRIQRGSNTLGVEGQCFWANLQDTWTHDIRNQTLPSFNLKTIKAQPKLKESLTLPNYLSSSKSIYTPTSCDSSWAFALSQTITDSQLKKTSSLHYKSLSVQSLLNCGVGSCQKGANIFDALLYIHKYGIPEEGCMGYKGTSKSQGCTNTDNCASCEGSSIFQYQCGAVKNYKRWKINDYGSISGQELMKQAVTNHGAITCGIYASNKFKQYTGGVLSETSIAAKTNHYVELIGYGSENGQNYWIGRNFYGTSWGISGFFKIKMGGSNLGVQQKCYWIDSIF